MQFNFYGRGFPLRVAITVACQLAFVLFGYDQGVFSGIVGNEDFKEKAGYPGDSLLGIIVSIYNLGCFTGCVLAFFFADYFGRRRSMWIAMVWIIVGAVLQTSAFSVPHLMIGRYITGIGTGIETSTTPVYHSELCEARLRGRLVSSQPLFVGVGIVISYWFDYGMSFAGGAISWRLPIGCQIIFALVVIVMVFGLPESPRYLCKLGRNDEALKVLKDVYHGRPEEVTQSEYQDIIDVVTLETERGEYKWSQILKQDQVQTGRRVLLAYGMQFMNQVGGINLVVYFIPTVLEDNVGLTRNLSLLLGGVIQIMFVIGSLVPTFFLDRLGRRRPMMLGSFGLGMCMMMIAILLSFKDKPQEKSTASASVAFFFLVGSSARSPPYAQLITDDRAQYMLIFGASVNCVPWVYVPEILPLHARAKGTAVGISSNWIWNFFVVMITPIIINRLQYKAYLIFMCTNLAFVPLVYFCYPETANLTLEEIDYLFVQGQSSVKESKRRARARKHGASGVGDLRGGSVGGHKESYANGLGDKGEVDVDHVDEKV
ncbi:MAG: hypothetical protein M1833_002236 [Piccolia ochrophora]|nr:MAG: hypothetical protein M1833_002236 [Piccolia ochrophora]